MNKCIEMLSSAVGKATTLITMLPLFLSDSCGVFYTVDDIVNTEEFELFQYHTGHNPFFIKQMIEEGKLDSAAVESALAGYYAMNIVKRVALVETLRGLS